jgi:WD40 repeat protein/serine/threonine protein kinase
MEIGTRLRAYEIRDLLGAGGFGVVYRAHQPVIGREVAIKVILPEHANQPDFIRRFEGEAQLVARLEHPHIVPLYDYWRDPEGAYLVMRYVRGGSLSQSIKRDGAWDLSNASRLLDQIASALAMAHRAGVVHRDIKPDNILLDEDGNAYLTDFGIAKRVQADSGDDEMTSGTLAYIAPEQLTGQPAQAASDQYALALVIAELVVGRHVYGDTSISELISKHLYEPLPDLRAMRVALPEAVNDVLFKAAAKNPEMRYADVVAFAGAFRRAVLGRDATAEFPILDSGLDVVNPFKGLRPFQQADAGDFYGREALINRLLSRLSEDLPGSRFLAVVGASGSGKSSVVKAGLIPTLRGGSLPGSEGWYIVEMTPGMNPLRELESVLLGIAQKPVSGLGRALRAGPDGLVKAVGELLPDDAQLLLVIDQFEEAFTMAPEADCNRLLHLITRATEEKDGPVRVIVTLRADFLDRPLTAPFFGDLLRRRIEFVLPMTPAELERAITGPLEQIGLEADPALVERITSDISEEPGALPLMQYALTEVFERRSGRVLTVAAYERIGGVTGALAKRADEVFDGLSPDGQTAARQMFLRLLTLGEGKEDTRRRAPLSELVSVIPDAITRQTTLDAFTRARLLTFDQDQMTREPVVEVAHEALIREWRRLRAWLDDSRADVRQQRQLAAAAEEWSSSRRDDSYLLSGTRLGQFEEWAAQTDLVLTPLERDYLSASVAERQRREDAEAARRAREAMLEARSRTVLRALAGVFALAALVSIGLLFVAARAREAAERSALRAEENYQRAEALRLASAANVLLYGQEANAETGALLAMRSLASQYSTEADAALVQSRGLMFADKVYRLGPALRSVAASPDGRYIAAGAENGQLDLIDQRAGDKAWGYKATTTIVGLAFSPDGGYLAVSRRDGGLLVFDVPTGTLHRSLPTNTRPLHTLRFTGPAALLTVDEIGRLTTWDIHTGERLAQARAELQDAAADLEIMPDGKTALLAGYFQAPLIDLETGAVLRVYDSLNNGLIGVAAAQGGLILTASQTGIARVWDAASGEELLTLTNHTSSVYDGAFWPDASGLVTISADGTARLWDLTTGAETRRLTGHTGAVRALALLPLTRQVVTASADGTVRVWNADLTRAHDRLSAHDSSVKMAWIDSTQLLTVGYGDAIVRRWDAHAETLTRAYDGAGTHHAVAVSPDGTRFAVGTRIHDMASGQLLREFPTDFWMNDVRFSPDGRLLAVAGMTSGADQGRTYTGLVEVWDIDSGQRVLRIAGHADEVRSVTFSPDSALLLTASLDDTVKLWQVSDGALVQTFSHNNAVEYAVFSPDGQTVLTSGTRVPATLWNVQSGLRIRSFSTNDSSVRGASFSPDGTRVATADLDGSLRIWDVQTGERLRRVVGFRAALALPQYSPDGRLIAVTAENGSVFIVRADIRDLIAETCTLLTRDLAPVERDRYRVADADATCPQFAEQGQAVLALPPTPLAPTPPAPTAVVSLPTPTEFITPQKVLDVRQVNRGSLQAGQVETWLYVGRRGQTLALRASADVRAYDLDDYFAGLDTQLVVFGIDGRVLAQNDDGPDGSGDAELSVTLPISGLYRIEVRSAGLATGGDYTLEVSVTDE